MMDDRLLAVMAEGRLYLQEGGGALRRHESDFARDILQRHQRLQQKHSWKAGQDQEDSMIPRTMLWGRGMGNESLPIAVSSVAPGEGEGRFCYVLETDAVGGLLDYDAEEQHERRLFHREGFRAGHLDRHPVTRNLVCSIPTPGGGANLAVIDPDGSNIREATEGDSFDDAPSWIAGEDSALVFQSAGLARGREGQVTGLGPFAIERLNLESGEMETLREGARTDYLQPHQHTDGSLYYIRRPWEGPRGPRPPWTRTLLDVVLFPVRLVRAVVHFLDAFSMFFSKKPLMTAGGPRRKGPDTNRLWVHGRMLEMKASREEGDAKGLAPGDWQLVRAAPDGAETVVARGVLAYDLAADGSLAYTNGRHIHVVTNGRPEKVAELSLAEMVKWL